MQTCFSSPIPAYFASIEKEANGYVCYACKDTGRKKRMNEVAFETYEEAKSFCQKKCPSFKILNF